MGEILLGEIEERSPSEKNISLSFEGEIKKESLRETKPLS